MYLYIYSKIYYKNRANNKIKFPFYMNSKTKKNDSPFTQILINEILFLCFQT